MMDRNVLVECADLGKRYGPRWLFRGLELQIHSGESLVIVGENGSGKSTLLKILAGVVEPSEGRTSFLLNGDKAQSRRSLIGWSAVEQSLYATLTVEEHLRFIADVRGVQLARGHFDRFGLNARERQLARELSTGLRQRLRLAMAALGDPPILLLDEPGSNLDEKGKAILADLLDNRKGITVIATNDEREKTFGNRLLCLGERSESRV